jgi:hypothetical protein
LAVSTALAAAAAGAEQLGQRQAQAVQQAEAADGAADDLLRQRHALRGGALAGARSLAAERGERGEQALEGGEVLQRQALRRIGLSEFRRSYRPNLDQAANALLARIKFSPERPSNFLVDRPRSYFGL